MNLTLLTCAKAQGPNFAGAAFLALTIITSSCGNRSSSQLKGGTPNPLLVMMGGFSTCATVEQHGVWESPLGMGLHTHGRSLRDVIRSESGVEFDVILSCFTKLAELRFAESADNYEDLHVDQGVDELSRRVHAAMDAHDKVFVVGHSYGGWLAMKTLASYSGSQDRVSTFYSIDPISRKTCRLEDPVHWGDCTAAPRDFSENDLTQVSTVVGRWINFWQSKTFYLHSGKIPFADDNRKLKASHTEIDDEPEVWASQLDDLRSILADRPLASLVAQDELNVEFSDATAAQ